MSAQAATSTGAIETGLGLTSTKPGRSFLLHSSLDTSQVILHAGVVRVQLEALLVGIACAEQVAPAIQSSSFSSPTLGPVGLELRRLFSILQGLVPLLLRGIGGRPVAVEDVVVRCQGDRLGKLVAVCFVLATEAAQSMRLGAVVALLACVQAGDLTVRVNGLTWPRQNSLRQWPCCREL